MKKHDINLTPTIVIGVEAPSKKAATALATELFGEPVKAPPRFTARKIGANMRPTVIYSFTVTGRGSFPFDMLRYDAAWPADGNADFTGRERRSINLRSYNEPTVDRWKSFMWSVGVETA